MDTQPIGRNFSGVPKLPSGFPTALSSSQISNATLSGNIAIMTTSAAGRTALSLREGVRLKAYRDSVGVWTIGVGHTSRAGPPHVWPWSRLSAVDCDNILASDLRIFEKAVNGAVKVTVSQNEFDAMVSLAFNIGGGGFTGSTVVHKLNHGDHKGAADAFLMWEKPPSLRGRREGERKQFLTP